MLDSLYPERETRWRHSWLRNEDQTIVLENFSFLDDPVGAVTALRRIAEAESRCRSLTIDFEDQFCFDMGPYMVLGLIRQKMLPINKGGRISDRVASVIEAVDLTDFLKMKSLSGTRGRVWPFKLRQRRPARSSKRDNLARSPTSEEKVGTQFAQTVDLWLKTTANLALSPEGKGHLLTLIGETLDNAKRHSDPVSADGTWAIAGFMEARTREDGTDAYVCHLTIISPGSSIAESLRFAPPETQQHLHRYSCLHGPRSPSFDADVLATALSLQDTISRVPLSPNGSVGGFGMMTLVETINALGASSRIDEQPRMTILSGSSCVMVRDEYRRPVKLHGHRTLAFNPEGRLDRPPDPAYVFRLPYRFPGTIVSLRFCLDPDELSKRSQRDDANA